MLGLICIYKYACIILQRTAYSSLMNDTQKELLQFKSDALNNIELNSMCSKFNRR